MMDSDRHPVFQKSAEMGRRRDYVPRGRLDPAGFERNVEFSMRPPSADLEQFLEHFWIVRWDLEDVVYRSPEVMNRPYVDVFMSASGSGIQGTFRGRKSYLAEGSGRIVGARFRPGAFRAFAPMSLAELQDQVPPLTRVFPEADDEFVARASSRDDEEALQILSGLLLSRNPRYDDNVDLLDEILARIEEDEELRTVEAVAKAFARSQRWMQQFFHDYAGINLKWFLQRHRVLNAAEQIRALDEPDWARLAYELGYASQQHFISDFKKALGVTPVQYRDQYRHS